MGGHGALTLAFTTGGAYTSVSAFAPICHPTECPWGKKAFEAYMGTSLVHDADATELMHAKGPFLNLGEVLIRCNNVLYLRGVPEEDEK